MEIDRTLYISNLPPDISDVLVYELFLQAGPLESVTLKGGYGFVTFEDEDSVLYSCSLFEGVRLYNHELKIRPRQGSKFENIQIKQYPPYAFTPQPPLLLEPSCDRPGDRTRYPAVAPISNSYMHEPRGHFGAPIFHNMQLLAPPHSNKRSYREPLLPGYDRRYRPY